MGKSSKTFITLKDICKAMTANFISLTNLYKYHVPSQSFMILFLSLIGQRKMFQLKLGLKYSLSNGEKGASKILQRVNLYYKACGRYEVWVSMECLMKFGDWIKTPYRGMVRGGMVCGIHRRYSPWGRRLLLVFYCSARTKSQKLVMDREGSGKGLQLAYLFSCVAQLVYYQLLSAGAGSWDNEMSQGGKFWGDLCALYRRVSEKKGKIQLFFFFSQLWTRPVQRISFQPQKQEESCGAAFHHLAAL